jgi:hypothetical protein
LVLLLLRLLLLLPLILLLWRREWSSGCDHVERKWRREWSSGFELAKWTKVRGFRKRRIKPPPASQISLLPKQ